MEKLNPPIKFADSELEELKSVTEAGQFIPETIIKDFDYQLTNQE
jgi:hypothetical protein